MNYRISELARLLEEASTYAKDHSWTVPPDLQHTLELWPQYVQLQTLVSLGEITQNTDNYAYSLGNWRALKMHWSNTTMKRRKDCLFVF
ncbi:hypothetical protein FA95DRAFT_323737 [Auriscalpium vulgare]|uniref:Uncharacterized protein n=1 Tax=Auriscalpium vulgare TaxID=40419 RepID=A0ACB8RJC9_9AGAM|nr:hypothetical protein FA95DRAFT_323737 [Auriscalpium vulgare]